jgi:hypothetical protein
MDYDELESAAGAVIGKIVFAFSRFEFNLGLCLRNLIAHGDVNAVNPLIQRLSFKHKLDALVEVIEHKFSAIPECVAEFKQWHRSIDALRAKRNSFVHGRWGVHEYGQQVINVAPGLPKSTPQKETQFSLIALQNELTEVENVIGQFSKLRTRWSL